MLESDGWAVGLVVWWDQPGHPVGSGQGWGTLRAGGTELGDTEGWWQDWGTLQGWWHRAGAEEGAEGSGQDPPVQSL